MSEKQQNEPVQVDEIERPTEELTDQQAEQTEGGILTGLLLPAVNVAQPTQPSAAEVPQDQVSIPFSRPRIS